MDERRITPRWKISQAAQLTVEHGVKAIPCVVEDISNMGMCVSLKRNLFDEVFSNCKLVLSDDYELDVSAHVAWRQEEPGKNIYGLSFNRIDKTAKENLDQYVNKNYHDLIVKHWWEGPVDNV